MSSTTAPARARRIARSCSTRSASTPTTFLPSNTRRRRCSPRALSAAIATSARKPRRPGRRASCCGRSSRRASRVVARLVRHRDRGRDQHAGGEGARASCASTSHARQSVSAPGITAIRTRASSSASPCAPTTSRASPPPDSTCPRLPDPTEPGDFHVQLVGGYLDRLEFIATPGAEVDVDLEEQYFPKFSANLDASWTRAR